MKCFLLLTVLAFASKNESDVESVAANSGTNIMDNAAENSIVVKIEEEDEYVITRSSNCIGVTYKYKRSKWHAARWSKTEKKLFNNGSYKDEETAAHASDTMARKLIANGEKGHKLNFPDDKTEVHPKKTSSKYYGVSFDEERTRWRTVRHSKNENKNFYNGTYRDEETAAHASDTLARKLICNGEKRHKLNFPDDNTEVYPDETKRIYKYFGVFYNVKIKKWLAKRWSQHEKRNFYNGYHNDEETAAHASDTLVRELMTNDEGLKLNFPDDNTEVHAKTIPRKYFGVSYHQKLKRWAAQRYSKPEKRLFNNGWYKDEETAAHASDSLARKLMTKGEQNHKLNFPDDNTEVYSKKKTTNSKYFGVTLHGKYKKWVAQRWSKTEKKIFYNGFHKNEETAANASDTLARKLMVKGEQNHKLNFPDNNTEVHQTNKRKRYFDFDSQTDEKDLEKFEE